MHWWETARRMRVGARDGDSGAVKISTGNRGRKGKISLLRLSPNITPHALEAVSALLRNGIKSDILQKWVDVISCEELCGQKGSWIYFRYLTKNTCNLDATFHICSQRSSFRQYVCRFVRMRRPSSFHPSVVSPRTSIDVLEQRQSKRTNRFLFVFTIKIEKRYNGYWLIRI